MRCLLQDLISGNATKPQFHALPGNYHACVFRTHKGPSMRTNRFCVTKINVSLNSRIKFFDSVVTSVVRFGAGQRKLYKSELWKLDVHCRKLLRQVVGPPGSIDWTQPWHSILRQWNQRVVEQMQLNGFELWSNRCMLDYWKFVGSSRSWKTAGGWNEHWNGMLEVAGEDDLLIYGTLLWQNFAGGWTLGSGRLQPRTKLSGCGTCRTLSHSCICNIFVRSHPLCPQWPAAPWHTGAKSKVKVRVSELCMGQWPSRVELRGGWSSQPIAPTMCSAPSIRKPSSVQEIILQNHLPLRSPMCCAADWMWYASIFFRE